MRLQAGAGRHLNILEIVMTASAVAVAGDDRGFNFNLPLYETAVIFVCLDTLSG